MKKLIALVLSVAMMLTLCALTASAETAPSLVIEGAQKVVVGEDYTVSIRLNDAGNVVGGFQGELTYTGATVKDIAVNPQVLDFNTDGTKDTVIKDDGDSVNFVTVGDIKGQNPATRIWFKVTFTVTSNDAEFALAEVVFAAKDAKALNGTFDSTLAPEVPNPADPTVSVDRVGIIAQVKPNDQAINVQAGIVVPEGKTATEYGVVFYPTSLLDGAELTVDTAGAVKAKLNAGEKYFDKFIEEGTFNALLHFDFSTDEKAAQFLGTKVSARAYVIADGVPYYSANTSDKYIQGGVADKAALNTILDVGAKFDADSASVTLDEYNAAIEGLNTSNSDWYANRCTALKFVVEHATAE